MKITDFLGEDLIETGVETSDKSGLCETIVDFLISKNKIRKERRQILLDKLIERESLSSTGIGGGVAIPHASGENIDDMIVAIVQIPKGVDYSAIDNEPVRLAFVIIGSERVPRVHLQLLATIVRACKNKELIEAMQEAGSSEDIYSLMLDFDRK